MNDPIIKITIDKNKLVSDLLMIINDTDDMCKTCAFEEQKTWRDVQMPVCNICEHDEFWQIREGILADVIKDCQIITGKEE